MKWKPKVGEMYYFPIIHACKVCYDIGTWENRQIDKERYKAGVICKDRYEVSVLAMKMLLAAKEYVDNE